MAKKKVKSNKSTSQKTVKKKVDSVSKDIAVQEEQKPVQNTVENTVTNTAQNTANLIPKRKVNWVLTLVMSIFFGWCGVDRFIMNQVGLGILKLITVGGCGIWWLVDIVLIATKHQFQDIEWVEQ